MTARRERLMLGWWIRVVAGAAALGAFVVMTAALFVGRDDLLLNGARVFVPSFGLCLVVVIGQAVAGLTRGAVRGRR